MWTGVLLLLFVAVLFGLLVALMAVAIRRQIREARDDLRRFGPRTSIAVAVAVSALFAAVLLGRRIGWGQLWDREWERWLEWPALGFLSATAVFIVALSVGALDMGLRAMKELNVVSTRIPKKQRRNPESFRDVLIDSDEIEWLKALLVHLGERRPTLAEVELLFGPWIRDALWTNLEPVDRRHERIFVACAEDGVPAHAGQRTKPAPDFRVCRLRFLFHRPVFSLPELEALLGEPRHGYHFHDETTVFAFRPVLSRTVVRAQFQFPGHLRREEGVWLHSSRDEPGERPLRADQIVFADLALEL